MRFMVRRPRFKLAWLLLATASCNAVLGFDDFAFGPGSNGPGDQNDGGAGDADTEASTGDGGDPCLATNKPVVEVTEVAADTTWECKNDYLLRNQVFVRSGATLTIQAGTTILGTRGDVSEFNKVSVLVVQPGGRIHAVGTAEQPIVFTSAKPAGQKKAGDWGGVVLLGNAIINQTSRTVEGVGGVGTEVAYGGNNDDDNSGTLKYVRIEYGGFKLSANNEINGLTFGGVGRGTQVDFVQIRHVLDDCFEFFGGAVNVSHLACQWPQDDGLDWDFGYHGKIQFVVIQQDPNGYDGMNGIEADNGGNATEWSKTPISEPTVYNITLCGPGQPTVRPTAPDGGLVKAQIRYGMLLRRHTRAHIFNSIFMGFEAGYDVDEYPAEPSPLGFTTVKEAIELKNVLFFGNVHAPNDDTANIAFESDDDLDLGYDEIAEFNAVPGNRTTDPNISGCFDPRAPSFGPATEISSDGLVPSTSDTFFVPVGYIGAFKDIHDPWATVGRWPVWSDQ